MSLHSSKSLVAVLLFPVFPQVAKLFLCRFVFNDSQPDRFWALKVFVCPVPSAVTLPFIFTQSESGDLFLFFLSCNCSLYLTLDESYFCSWESRLCFSALFGRLSVFLIAIILYLRNSLFLKCRKGNSNAFVVGTTTVAQNLQPAWTCVIFWGGLGFITRMGTASDLLFVVHSTSTCLSPTCFKL